jgi:transposase
MRIVIEASTKSFWMADQIEALGHEPIVVDPGRTKAIGSALIKHDKLDARVLATLGAADVLAKVSRPTLEERLARTPVVIRDGLVQCRTKLLNTVRSVLDAEGFDIPSSSVAGFTAKVCSVLDEAPRALCEAVTPMLEAIDALSTQIATCDEAIEQAVRSDPVALRLMTAPGVGPIVASYFTMAVRDPARFKSGRQVGAYLGLVPSLYESGQTSRRGRITKHGSRKARWAMTVASNAILQTRTPSRLRDWGLLLVKRLGRKKAIVAIARKLANVLWSMWKNERAFDPTYGMA